MAQFFSINGGKRLEGEVTVSGSKNAAVAIIPAAVLAGEPCIIENLPQIRDVISLQKILQKLGANTEYTPGDCMKLDPRGIKTIDATFSEISSMRASYYLLGAMLAANGEVELALPGGCVIGSRPIDQHIRGFRALGAKVYLDEARNVLRAQAARLRGAEIFFDVVSVGATINVMLAATKAEGTTVLHNVAKEPHIVDTANFLNMMGANVRGAGTDEIRIHGVKEMHGCVYSVIPDQIETGTYMIAAAATRGDVIVKNVIPPHMESVSAKLLESGARVTEGDDGKDFFLRVTQSERPRAVSIKTMVYPGFPTDLQQPMMAYLATANGISVITENIFENRFNHVRELRALGASINVNKRVAKVKGVPCLHGGEVSASDLRAGASLIVAALSATGTTCVRNIGYIDRGYEYLEQKLRALGADIERVDG